MRPVTYEPDKYWSAVQAATLLVLVVVPLVLTISLRKVVINTPVTVAIVAAPPPPPAPAPDTEAVREQIEAAQRNLEQAALARQRIEEVEAQAAAERLRIEEQERQRREEERLQREELERQQQAEEKKQREEQEEQERQRRAQEEQRQRELEEQRQLEAQAAAQRQLEVDARLKAAQDERLMARYIAAIHDRIKRHMTNPEGVSTDIQVEIRVPLQPDGRLATNPEIISSSGHAQFDEQAIRAVLRGAEDGFELPPDKELRDEFNELLLIIRPQDGQ